MRSSIASVLAAGIAALILYCVEATYPERRSDIQNHLAMRNALKNYTHVWKDFGSQEFRRGDFDRGYHQVRALVDKLMSHR
jgi:hypothetical protein